MRSLLLSVGAACCALAAAPSVRAQDFNVFEPTGQFSTVVTMNGPTLIVPAGNVPLTFTRRIDLDEPGYLVFEQQGANKFARWPTTLPGSLYFGSDVGGVVQWTSVKTVAAAVAPVDPAGPIGQAGPRGPIVPGGILPRRPRRTLLGERVIPNPPLGPVEVTVENPHREDLLVGFVDLRKSPPKPKEHSLPAGKSKKFLLDRDSGATLERTYELLTPAGQVVQQVETIPVPPAHLWDVVVWEYKVTYQVAGQPELTRKSRRSLGVVPLPAGQGMPPSINIYQEAIDMRNPGAASAYPVPTP